MNLEDCPGICAQYIREMDWAQTPMGPSSAWSPRLRQLLYMALRSSAPKLWIWGERQTTFFNDALAETLCAGPQRIGLPFCEFHEEAWEHAGEAIARTLQGIPLQKSEVGTWCAGEGNCQGVPWLELCYTSVLDEHGTPTGVLIDVRDLSRARQREAALQAEIMRLQRLSDDAVFMIGYTLGAEFRIEYVNKALRRLFPGRELVGKTVKAVLPEFERRGYLDSLRTVFRTGQPWMVSGIPVEVRDSASGQTRTHYVDLACTPLLNEEGRILGIMGTGSDVTERYVARLEAERLRHQLLHNSRINAMGTMAMTLAHELNQPLAAAANLIGAARLLAGSSAPETGAALDRAQAEIQRAGGLIRRMRSLVRSGPSESASISIEQAFLRTASLLDASGSHDVTLTLKLAPDATHVVADQIQLEQILTNLFRNSIQASANSTRKEIILSTERTGSETVRITVRDHGPGFPPDRLDNVFEYDGPANDDGMGIGLPLTRTLVEANGGDIQVANAASGGAIAHITLHGQLP